MLTTHSGPLKEEGDFFDAGLFKIKQKYFPKAETQLFKGYFHVKTLTTFVFFLDVKLLIPATGNFMADKEGKKHYS